MYSKVCFYFKICPSQKIETNVNCMVYTIGFKKQDGDMYSKVCFYFKICPSQKIETNVNCMVYTTPLFSRRRYVQ